MRLTLLWISLVLLWISLVSIARADVIFDDGPPPFRPRHRPNRVLPEEQTVPDAEPWHPNFEVDLPPDPDTSDDSAGFIIIATWMYFVWWGRSKRRST